MNHRTSRFVAWSVAVGLVWAGPLIARSGVPARHAIAAAWTLAHLSAIVWMLAHPARRAIRLPALLSEAIVLGGAPFTLYLATGEWGAAAALSCAFLLINHARIRPFEIRPVPALGNPWRLVPALWHPALWLVALHAPGTGGAWAGVALVPCAHGASVLTRSPARAVRVIAWIAWGAVAVTAIAALPR